MNISSSNLKIKILPLILALLIPTFAFAQGFPCFGGSVTPGSISTPRSAAPVSASYQINNCGINGIWHSVIVAGSSYISLGVEGALASIGAPQYCDPAYSCEKSLSILDSSGAFYTRYLECFKANCAQVSSSSQADLVQVTIPGVGIFHSN